MEKRILFLILLMTVVASFTVLAADSIDLSKIKTEDLRLEKGQNTSLILGPGSPFSIRLSEGTKVEFENDGLTNWVVFDKLGDTATVRYTLDAGKTVKEEKIKLGDSTRWMVTTGSLFVFLNYKIYNTVDKNAIFEIGIPYLERSEVPVDVNQTKYDELAAADNASKSSSDGYLKYLVGIIIVLIVILIILGPKKKSEEANKIEVKTSPEPSVEAVKESPKKKENKAPEKKKGSKGASTKKTYYTKPKKKSFDEEDVYVVKPSDEE